MATVVLSSIEPMMVGSQSSIPMSLNLMVFSLPMPTSWLESHLLPIVFCSAKGLLRRDCRRNHAGVICCSTKNAYRCLIHPANASGAAREALEASLDDGLWRRVASRGSYGWVGGLSGANGIAP